MNIFPQPKHLVWKEGAFAFGSLAEMQVNCALREDRRQLLRTLWNRFSFTASALTICENDLLPANAAVLGEGSVPALAAEDEYAVLVSPKGVGIAARNETGLLHAMYSLLQVIDPVNLDHGAEKLEIPALEIHDCPSIAFRCVHICMFPETSLLLLEKSFSLAGLLKCSHIVLEFWGTLQYDALPEMAWSGRSYSKRQIKPLIDLANAFGMEVIPMLNHLGHASQSRGGMGKHTVLDQNPRLATLFEGDGWTWCLSNPRTHTLLRSFRNELTELCGKGGYFHLGCDEAYSYATCRRCAGRDSIEMLTDYLNGLAAELGEQGRKGIVWGDQFLERAAWPNFIANSTPKQPTHLALEKLDRRLIMADWQYDSKEGPLPTATHFKNNGFTTLLCPWDGGGTANTECLAKAVVAQDLDGIMITTWHHLPTMNQQFPWLFDAAWNGECLNGERGNAIAYTAPLIRKLLPKPSRFEDSGYVSWEVDSTYTVNP